MIPDDVQAWLTEIARTTPHSLRSLNSTWLFLRSCANRGDAGAAEILDRDRFAGLIDQATELFADPLALAQRILDLARPSIVVRAVGDEPR
jgi:hypothetical protein